MRDPLSVPGTEHPWLRRALIAPVSSDHLPLTVEAVKDVRRVVVLQIEHGVVSVRRGRALLRRLDVQEAWIREHEFRP
jgi:hypothetical protein